MQPTLFDLGEGYFFDRMLEYRNRLDDGERAGNGYYNSTFLEALAFARDAYENGHPKGRYHLMYMMVFAENVGLIPRQNNEKQNEPRQLLLFYNKSYNPVRAI